MSISIEASVSKKVPIPGQEFSSRSASLKITAEVTSLADIAGQAARLYQEAEAAIDVQLGITAPAVTPHPSQAHQSQVPPQPMAPRPSQASTPYRANSQRRSPAPITDSQLRFIDRLLIDAKIDLNAILQHHQVGSLRDLTCKQGAALIDELKGGVAA